MWSDERTLVEALMELARSRATHDLLFLAEWRDYAFGADEKRLSEEEALAALDWLAERLDMPVNPDA